MELGKKILEYRKKNGLSQEELGEKINVTRQTISNWELGETSPNIEQLKMLSKELNVSIDELLDNEIENVLVEKVSNTERLAGLILKIIKIFLTILGILFLLFIIGVVSFKFIKKSNINITKVEESIHCEIYGEEHGYNIVYDELTGVSIEEGGDTYFYDILDLGKYTDAHQKFNIINDYVKKNGGTCETIKDKDLSGIIDISIKEGTLTKTGATILLKKNVDYNISYGEDFWIEKYENSIYTKLDTIRECAFNMPAYGLRMGETRELKQDWSCMYGHLDKGIYRLVKYIDFDSDIPITPDDVFYAWVEFEIE